MTFDLYLMDNSTTVQEAFVITKDCGGVCVCEGVRVGKRKHVLMFCNTYLGVCVPMDPLKFVLLTTQLSTVQCINTRYSALSL